MLWVGLRIFLAWWTARLIKRKIFKSDFDKPSAAILAIVWGIIWGVGAAFAFEFTFGAGTFQNRTLVPSILFTAVASYYAFVAEDFQEKPPENQNNPKS